MEEIVILSKFKYTLCIYRGCNEKERKMDGRRSFLWIIAGGYVVYLGGSLFQNLRVEQPTNYMWMTAGAVFLMVAGAGLFILGLRPVLKKLKNNREPEEVTPRETVESGEENLEAYLEDSESNVEPGPKKPKTMRERAMLGSLSTAETQEIQVGATTMSPNLRGYDTEKMPKIPPSSLEDVDVGVASEDIIAATEEIMVSQEIEDAIVTINKNGSGGRAKKSKPKKTQDDGLTKMVK